MKMKFLIITIVTIFSLNVFGLTNEEKARKLFVETKLELEIQCRDVNLNNSILESLNLLKNISKYATYDLTSLDDLREIEKSHDKIISCFTFVKNIYLESIKQIQTKYPTTQVAYDVTTSVEIQLLKQNTDEILSSLLDEKKRINRFIEIRKDFIEKENNKAIDCFTSEGLKYEKKNIEGCNEGDFDYNPVGLTNEEIDVLINQLRGCFIPRAGIQINGDELVTISANVSDNGRIISPTVRLVSSNISKNNQYYEALIENALSTLHHPSCSLLKVPLDKYDSWKNLKITIDYSWIK
jgi:hypothetical protein